MPVTELTAKTFGFLLFSGTEELDLVGPWEMVGLWRKYAGGPRSITIAATSDPVRCAKGLVIQPDIDFSSAGTIDFLLVPGGEGVDAAARRTEITEFISQTYATAQHLLSVCTGAFLLDAAGLLSDQRVATHYAHRARLQNSPGVTVSEERWVQSGNIWSSAGISAGIDLTLAFISHVAGADVERQVRERAEYHG